MKYRRSGKPRGVTPGYRARQAERLPAAERRQALLDAATRVFAEGSYSGATTAEIARAAGVSEPILYRHFGSKRELYLAVIEHAWEQLRAAWEEALEKAEPHEMAGVLFATVRRIKQRGVVPSLLWVQALTEAGEDAEIRRFIRRHLREVHDFVAGGLLFAVAHRLGGLLDEEDIDGVVAARREWLTS